MHMNTVFRERVDKLQGTAKEERELWDRKKSTIQEDFMKELEQETGAKKPAGSGLETPASVDDDDAVLVESGGPAASSGVGKKKKKGKK